MTEPTIEELRRQRAAGIREHLRVADELALFGKKPAQYAAYLAAAKALDMGGAADGH